MGAGAALSGAAACADGQGARLPLRGAGSRPVPRRRAVRSADGQEQTAVSAVVFLRVRFGADGAGTGGSVRLRHHGSDGVRHRADAVCQGAPGAFFRRRYRRGARRRDGGRYGQAGDAPGVRGVFELPAARVRHADPRCFARRAACGVRHRPGGPCRRGRRDAPRLLRRAVPAAGAGDDGLLSGKLRRAAADAAPRAL